MRRGMGKRALAVALTMCMMLPGTMQGTIAFAETDTVVTEDVLESEDDVTEEVTEEATEEVSEETTEESSEEASEEITEDATEESSEDVSEETTEETTEEVSEETVEDATEDIEDIDDEIVDADEASSVAINATTFPDEAFRKYISSAFDKDKNGILSAAEISAATVVNISPNAGVKSVKGIEYLTNMTILQVMKNPLASIDLSKSPQLEWIILRGCPITTLDVTNNVNLKTLSIGETNITYLNVSGMKKLEAISCGVEGSDSVVTIDASNCPMLKNVHTEKSPLKSLNVKGCSNLYEINVLDGNLTSVDVTTCPNLVKFCCNKGSMSKLDFTNCPKLRQLVCSNLSLNALDYTYCPNLIRLDCSNNALTTLDLTKFPDLRMLSCQNNKLLSLDLSKCPGVWECHCENNQLMCLNLLVGNSEYITASPQKTVRGETDTYQIDLSLIPGFDISRMSNLKGGTLSGTVVKSTSRSFSYDYSCNKSGGDIMTVNVTLNAGAITSARKFVTRMYTKCLGRKADAAGVDYWSKQLALKNKTGATCAYGFVFSDEYTKKKTSDDAYIKMLYEVFMDRKADQGGINYWKGLMSEGVSREYVFNGFVTSAEFKKICDSYGIDAGRVTLTQNRDKNLSLTKYVNRIYTKAMNRKGEPDGLNYWCGQILAKKMSPVAVAEQFIYSKEFTDKKLNDTEYIKVLYRTFMGREADTAGLNYWLGQMKAGKTRKQVLQSFTGCKEFQDIIKSFGL